MAERSSKSTAEQLVFADREEFREWLGKNHGTNKGAWLVFSKVQGLKTLKASEALEEALCFGWIDGQIKSLGDERYLKKFTPRTNGSRWSGVNRALAMRLTESARMTEPGLAAIERAKRTGAWDAAHGRPPISDDQVEVLTNALQGADLALRNFLKMPPSVRRTYTMAYLDAKTEETRARRLERIIERLNANKRPM
jgi:uncharacterized protein YdeI (YjbR/CyaY-like superfamily)